METDVAAAIDGDNETATALTDLVIGICAVALLEMTTFDAEVTSGGVLTDTNHHRRHQQADSTSLRRLTHSGAPFSPPDPGVNVSLEAILQDAEENDESLASGLIYIADISVDYEVVYRYPPVLRNTHDDGVVSWRDIYSLLDLRISHAYMKKYDASSSIQATSQCTIFQLQSYGSEGKG
jgi:hypothetical protein